MIAAVLPSWERWAEAGPALLTFRVTQVLTGHGCFGEYLKRIGAELTANCHHCSARPDSAQHTLEECAAFEEQRCTLVTAIGPDLTPPAIVKALLASGNKCAAVTSFCEEVMSCKEAAERERERTASGRRRGKRRRPPGRAKSSYHGLGTWKTRRSSLRSRQETSAGSEEESKRTSNSARESRRSSKAPMEEGTGKSCASGQEFTGEGPDTQRKSDGHGRCWV